MSLRLGLMLKARPTLHRMIYPGPEKGAKIWNSALLTKITFFNFPQTDQKLPLAAINIILMSDMESPSTKL